MNTINDGGPAFGQVVTLKCVRVDPTGAHEYEPETCAHGGVTIRDYFAAKAMEGMFAAFKHWPRGDEHSEVAQHAYQAADAMLAVRGKP